MVEEAQRLAQSEKRSYREFAVMYRTNAQSRPLEEAFVRSNIPYRLVGGTRFYERREVKDLLAYLRLVHNPFDSIALLRVVNVPHRAIGDRTVAELNRWAGERSIPLYAALQLIAESERDSPESAAGGQAGEPSPHPFQKRSAGSLLRFLGLLNELIALAGAASLSDVLEAVMDRTEYKAYLLAEADGEERWENVQELRAVAAQYDELKPEQALSSFLEDAALITDVDGYDEGAEAVTLITLHAAKGLEFPVVFIVGLEEGLLPHMRSLESGDAAQLEEERRLCYVGMTRRSSTSTWCVLPPGLRGPYRAQPAVPVSGRHPFGAGGSEPAGGGSHPPGRSPSLRRGCRRRRDCGGASGAVEMFAAGDHVRHGKFGEGIVVSCEPSGADYQIVVAFRGEAGIKKLLLSFASLERWRCRPTPHSVSLASAARKSPPPLPRLRPSTSL